MLIKYDQFSFVNNAGNFMRYSSPFLKYVHIIFIYVVISLVSFLPLLSLSLSFSRRKKGHNAAIQCLTVMMDSRRIISADRDGLLCVWLAESGTLLQTIQGPYKSLAATNNMKFGVSTVCTHTHSEICTQHH